MERPAPFKIGTMARKPLPNMEASGVEVAATSFFMERFPLGVEKVREMVAA